MAVVFLYFTPLSLQKVPQTHRNLSPWYNCKWLTGRKTPSYFSTYLLTETSLGPFTPGPRPAWHLPQLRLGPHCCINTGLKSGPAPQFGIIITLKCTICLPPRAFRLFDFPEWHQMMCKQTNNEPCSTLLQNQAKPSLQMHHLSPLTLPLPDSLDFQNDLRWRAMKVSPA